MPARPDPPIPPDATSQAVRDANALLMKAIDHLRDARDLFDEASEVPGLPEGKAGWFSAHESVIESLRQTLERSAEWTDDKAELLYSKHSPVTQPEQPEKQP